MRRYPPQLRSPARLRPDRAGAALIFVLTALSLITLLVLAITTLMNSEGRATRAVVDMNEILLYKELPEKLVMAQIRKATHGLGTRYTWTSQPGLIRVFGTSLDDRLTDPPRARAEFYHKLYSAPAMSADATSPGSAIGQADMPPQDWQERKALWIDLNEPAVLTPTRKQTAPGNTPPTRIFPILDPAAIGAVDGFDVKALPTSRDTNAPTSQATTLPMPVQWLYVLRDGTIVPPTDSGEKGSVHVEGATPDTQSNGNPIVARVAFWTDDEACKLNLNTASEGAPWQPPHTHTETDKDHAESMPASSDHYRMSAHVAATSLVPALRRLGQVGKPPLDPTATVPEPQREPANLKDNGEWWNHVKDYLALAPRGPWRLDQKPGSAAGTNSPTAPAAETSRQRLYTTVDELFFTAKREKSGSRNPDADNEMPELNEAQVRAARFFLTTHSRAPELNLFNRPKVSLWPVSSTPGDLTDLDKDMMRCASLGAFGQSGPASDAGAYYWQRGAMWDGTTGASQNPNSELAGRNVDLISYLQDLTSERLIPGFGHAFLGSDDKFSERSRDQLLLSMFDLMRWNENTFSGDDAHRYLPGSNDDGAWGAAPLTDLDHSVFDSQPPDLKIKAYGRYPTIGEIAIVFFATDEKSVAAFLVLEPFMPAPGFPSWRPNIACEVSGLDALELGSANPNGLFKNGTRTVQLNLNGNISDDATHWNWGGGHSSHGAFAAQFLRADGSQRLALASATAEDDASEDEKFVFLSAAVAMSPGQPISFSGGTLRVKLRDPYWDKSIQELSVYLPQTEIPAPTRVGGSSPNGTPEQQMDFRMKPVSKPGQPPQFANLIQPGDVVRSVQFLGGHMRGDLRLLSALHDPPTTVFVESEGYKEKQPRADSLRDGAFMTEGQVGQQLGSNASRFTFETGGEMVIRPNPNPPRIAFSGDLASAPEATNTPSLAPYMTADRGLTMALAPLNADGRAGDFNTGPGIIEDGPYITSSLSTSGANPTTWFQRGGNFDETNYANAIAPWAGAAGSGFLFGSLPTGVHGMGTDPNALPRPWQTLLLCPNPASRTTTADKPVTPQDHFGFRTPRDHLWLEYFWMPTARPHGFAERFATEGKVNMNYQLRPFTWIKRATAMHGALHTVRITAIPTTATFSEPHYKSKDPMQQQFRYAVDAKATLAAFDRRFDPVTDNATSDLGENQDDVFRSPSEICDQWLVPQRLKDHSYGPALVPEKAVKDQLKWWEGPDLSKPDDGFEATGDNLREDPYAQLYPRLCTRSNVFTVHWRVQLLRKARSTDAETWVEPRRIVDPETKQETFINATGTDQIVGEQRGQTMVERYLAPESKLLRDFATQRDDGEALDDYYRIRVVHRRDFTP